jgi:hypothetical protein
VENEELMKRLFYFSVGMLFSLLLVVFGSRMLFYPADDINGLVLLLLGLGLVLGSVFIFIPSYSDWRLFVLIIGIGFYFCIRAAGGIDIPWLARLLGIASWIAAAILLYITWPTKKPAEPKPDAQP